MKARDIIPGWPRGRSTTTAASNCLESKEEQVRLHAIFGRGALAAELLTDLAEDLVYHGRQQALVDRYRAMASWRVGDYWPMPRFEWYLRTLYGHFFEGDV